MPDSGYIHTDTSDDLASTLELTAAFLIQARDDDRYWKWVVYGMHSAVQSTAALALDHGNGFLAQKPGVMQKMLDYHANPSSLPPVSPHMDNFQRLVEKSVLATNLQSNAIPLSDLAVIEGVKALDAIRGTSFIST